jgi:aryl-alcohol dehydrogenase-like predicted oxidoreductase
MTTPNNPLHHHQLGLGTWQWGDNFFWRYQQSEADLRGCFEATQAAGVTLFDTAEVYGNGNSEKFLGRFVNGVQAPTFVATKFMPLPWRLTKSQLLSALKGSLKRLNLPSVDLYQMHWPFPPVSIETWMDALAEAVQAGWVRAVGVSNYSVEQTRRAYVALKKHGVPLASNQVPFSLLARQYERDGLLVLCQELDIRVMAYSPLEQGLLSGKYSPQNPPPGLRGRRYAKLITKVEPVVTVLRELGEKHGGKTPAQVALNWCMGKGTLPIPGARTIQQAEQNVGALGWALSTDEMARLDEVSERVTRET